MATKERSCRQESLHFLSHNLANLTYHPDASIQHVRPAIVATFLHPRDIVARAKQTCRIPFHAAECLVEVVDDLSGPLTTDIKHLLDARPDMAGVYFILLNEAADKLRVGWMTAAGVDLSKAYLVQDSDELLQRFVYSLYVPPSDHVFKDATVRMELPCPCQATTWAVTVLTVTYTKAVLTLGSDVNGRRTAIFTTTAGDKEVVIREQYMPLLASSSEAPILNAVHSNGRIDAVVSVQDNMLVKAAQDAEYIAVDRKGTREVLVKRRYTYADGGVSWSEAKSVKDLLMSAYDVVEGMLLVLWRKRTQVTDPPTRSPTARDSRSPA